MNENYNQPYPAEPVSQEAPQQPAYQQPVYQQPVYNATPQPEDTSSKVLTFGIIGLVLSELGILGLIFSIIGLKQANQYYSTFGTLIGKAKVGKILSKVGLIVSIVMTVFWAIYIIVVAAMAASIASVGYYY